MSIAAETVTVPTGRANLEAIRDGIAPPPPAAVLLDLDLETVDDGRTVFGFHPAHRFTNPYGATHGGILAAVADFAVATAVMTRLSADAVVVTTNLNVTYVRSVTSGVESMHCEGRVLHLGRRLAHAEATLTDGDGRVYLHATATCHVG
jgi:uncharacterized protein (TIGR00369 family)